MCLAVAISAFLLVQKSPINYYVYCLLPVPVWYSVLKEWVKHMLEKVKQVQIINADLFQSDHTSV